MRIAKTVLVAMLFLFAASTTLAQEEETLLGGGLESGGYGAPVVKFTTIKGEFGVMVGGYGGWLINHVFMIGGGGFGLVTSHAPESAGSFYGIPLDGRMEFGYGGGILEYIFSPMSMVHSSVTVLVGAGSVSYGMHGYDSWDMWNGYTQQRDQVFVLEPSLNVELNVTSFFRVNAGASYRYVSGVSMYGLKNADLSGASINVALKFGAF